MQIFALKNLSILLYVMRKSFVSICFLFISYYMIEMRTLTIYSLDPFWLLLCIEINRQSFMRQKTDTKWLGSGERSELQCRASLGHCDHDKHLCQILFTRIATSLSRCLLLVLTLCWDLIFYSILLPWLGVFKYINQCHTALAGGI